MHSCQRKCICGSLNACSDQVFATLSMLYLPIADCRLPVALCSAHCTNHCTVCTVQIADCRACLEYCICRLHLRLLVGCYALAISVQCSLLLTAQITLCTVHKSHCIAVSCACAKLFSPPQIKTIFDVRLSAHEMFSETTLDG